MEQCKFYKFGLAAVYELAVNDQPHVVQSGQRIER